MSIKWKIIYKTYPLYHHGEKSRVVRAKDKDDAKNAFRRTSPDTKIIDIVKEDAPVNATGTPVAGTGDDSSTVVVKKKKKLQDKLMRRLKIKETLNRLVPDLEYPKDEITERKNQLKAMAKKNA
jgi:hypothetical protein